MKHFPFALLFLSFLVQSVSCKPITQLESEGMDLQVEEIASGLGVPWGMVFIGPNSLFITERQGSAKILHTDTGRLSDVTGLPSVYAEGQGGLLDVAIPTGYQVGDWIYFTYSKEMPGGGATTLARAKLNGNRLINWQDLLVTDSVTENDIHFGSRITFDGAGHLYFTVGERGERPNAQDLTNHAGSVLRLNLDGSVPDDNPFVKVKGARPEIWSYGHRNPQGIVYDEQNNRLWLIEHGPRGGDEINLIQPGRNYGWPIITYGKEYWGPVSIGEGYEKEGMEQPVKQYAPSIAPGSLILYSGKAIPAWKGNLIAGSLVLQHLNRIEISPQGKAIKEERLLESLGERIRAVTESNEGWLYLSTDSGRILRIKPVK